MRLGADTRGLLVREEHLTLLDDFRSQFTQSIVLSLVGSTAFFGGGVQPKDHTTVLVGVAERVESSLTLLVVVSVDEHVASVAPPGRLRDFVVEETAAKALSKLFPSEPLEYVGFLPFTNELSGGPLGAEVVHGILPSLARVSIEFPTVLLFGCGPVRDSETLEQGSRLTVETDVTNAFEESAGVEVLGEQVVHDIRFLVEFVAVNILHAHAGFASFFDMESVGNKEEVWMNELKRL